MCDMAANSLPQARAGGIKPIAVMSKTRWFAAPDVPTAEGWACRVLPSRSGTAWAPRRHTEGDRRQAQRRCRAGAGRSAVQKRLPTRATRSRRATGRRRTPSGPITRPRSRSGGRSSKGEHQERVAHLSGRARNTRTRSATTGVSRGGRNEKQSTAWPRRCCSP